MDATGVANVDTGEPITPETVLHVASLTKPVTCAAFVTVAPELVDSPVVEVMPQLIGTWRVSPELTPRDLLSHRSGLRNDLDRDALAQFGSGDDALARAVGLVVSSPPAEAPRTVWEYCNAGYWLAGHALALLSGATFESAVAQAVFQPAGMVGSGFEPMPGVCGHRSRKPMEPGYLRARNPGSGMFSNVPDLLAFAEHLLDSPAVLTAMTKVSVATPEGTWYGLGCHLADREASIIWHRGTSFSGFKSCLLIVPQHRYAAVALTNDFDGDPAIDDFLRVSLAEATGLGLPWKPAS
ncbi:hypothetical protein Rhe02_86030 [Rhizocola hellebori]|uniref:Beta-lactamase-related domain-containing protein n=2 Tax=Rhizocola hellebori TaxID=1392758 RepID=A0A8J3QJZ6_9ACTN|nr:hypothetical protein Rhe02_86030 [Rhizocola hellebori]